MSKRRSTSRLQRIEAKKNTKQALLFVLLSIGFLLLLLFVGVPLFIKAAVFLGDARSSEQKIDKSDTIAPIPPRFISTFEATNSADITLEGYSEPASTVVLYKNKEKYKDIVTDSDGKFVFESVRLRSGDNDFHTVAIDPSGNESQTSSNLTIAFDDEAPELTITQPDDGKTFYDDEREILVAGEVDDEDIHVKVNGFVVVVDTEGNFVKRLNLQEGENEIEVKAYDDAGNEVIEKIKVNYSK